ncbi:MAG: hypothetical protein ACUVRT_11990 [Armatimonadota bacterium]
MRWFFILASPMVLIALAVYPSTGWLLRQHLSLRQDAEVMLSLIASTNREIHARLESRFRQVAQQHPNDYQVQLAWAVISSSDSREARMQNLRGLLDRFGDRASLCAHILRYSTASEVYISRSEETPGVGTPPLPQPPPLPEVLAEFDRVAAQGERLDPDNAFFPMMRAVGYFAGKRDREAVQALLRASRKSRYDDYTSEEPQSLIRLYTLAYGHPPIFLQDIFLRPTVFPHYSSMRSMAQMSQYMAMQADKAGRAQEAAEIRVAMMRCGSLIRTQARNMIGNIVGSAIIAIGGYLPRAVPSQQTGDQTPEERERLRKQRETEFVQHLRRLGRTEDAKWAEHEFWARQETHNLISQAYDDFRSLPDFRIGVASAISGAISTALLTAGLSVLLLWLMWLLLSPPARGGAVSLLALVIALFAVGTALWLLPMTTSSLVFVRAVSTLNQSTSYTTGQIEKLIGGSNFWGISDSPDVLHLVGVLANLLWLILLAGIVTIVGVMRRQSAGDALMMGLRRNLPPIAGFLFLLYAVALLYNVRVERQGAQVIQEMLQHQGAYVLRTIGKQIPQ